MTLPTSRRKMLALCGTMVGLAGCSGGGTDTVNSPKSTDIPTTSHESTITPTPTQSPTPDPSLLRTAIIDADNIDEGFEAPALERIVIGQVIAIFYEAEVPVQDGTYEAVVYVGLSEFQGYLNSMEFFPHEGSADGETARIVGHAPPQPTEEFVPGELGVHVAVGVEMHDYSNDELLVVPVVPPIEEGKTDD